MSLHRLFSGKMACVLAMAALGLSPARGAPAATYCRADESIVFSCDFGSHTASVCASREIAPGKGFLQYRFGHLDRVLMSYPPADTRPADAFTVGTLMFSGGGGAWLRFEDQRIRYTVFTAIGRWNPKGRPLEVAGVVMEQDGKEMATMSCRGAAVSALGSTFFEQAGLKAVGDFDIPGSFFPK